MNYETAAAVAAAQPKSGAVNQLTVSTQREAGTEVCFGKDANPVGS
jgi:hypothetical protein